jgi:hypothetical protein
MSEQITEGELLIRDVFRAIYSQEDDVPLVAFALGAAEVNLQLRDMRQLAQELAEAVDTALHLLEDFTPKAWSSEDNALTSVYVAKKKAVTAGLLCSSTIDSSDELPPDYYRALAQRFYDMLFLVTHDSINTNGQSAEFNAIMAEGKRIWGDQEDPVDDRAKTECYLEDGTLLWETPYGFKSMFKVGQGLIENRKRYIVLSAVLIGKTQHIIAREAPCITPPPQTMMHSETYA